MAGSRLVGWADRNPVASGIVLWCSACAVSIWPVCWLSDHLTFAAHGTLFAALFTLAGLHLRFERPLRRSKLVAVAAFPLHTLWYGLGAAGLGRVVIDRHTPWVVATYYVLYLSLIWGDLMTAEMRGT